MVSIRRCPCLLLVALALSLSAIAQEESDYYQMLTLPTPSGVAFEVGGMTRMPDGALAIAIRKGEVWLLENPYEENLETLRYKCIAYALHEPLGLLYHKGDLYTTQRSELTRMRDTDNDGAIDVYETVTNAWGLTGNYHEYAYGPVLDRQGRFWITLNQTIGPAVDKTDNAWRGWGMTIDSNGVLSPMCAGMRSPAGLGTNALGDAFYTDQQGNWVPTNSLHQLRRGVFFGHPDSFRSADREGSPLKRPARIPAGLTIPEVRDALPDFRPPAIWFPYRKVGMSATDIACDQTQGKFGPFAEQLFVGDFTMAQISRVFLEKVNGEYQGAVVNFRRGFQCAIVRTEWGSDGSLFVGQTNRGWNSAGSKAYGVQRLTWTGQTPFEIEAMRARPDGFRLTFTQALNKTSASNPASYALSSYTYHYHESYGSDEINTGDLKILSAQVAPDGRTVDLQVEGLREGYVHELAIPGLRSQDGKPLLHDTAYYTLNAIPE